jgi:hypothetical protein
MRALFCVTALALSLWPASSQADIIFTLGNNPQPDEENVLLNQGTSGNTIFGVTNQSALIVQFDSTQTLVDPPQGQARIEAKDGTDQIGLTNVTITVPDGTYGDIIFNPTITGTVGEAGGTLTVNVTDNFAVVHPFEYTLGNGNNFLTIIAVNDQRIVSTTLSYDLLEGFSDLRQIRISGGQLNAVPEPVTLVLVGVGLLGTLFAVRRRRV